MIDISNYMDYQYHLKKDNKVGFCHAHHDSSCPLIRLDPHDDRVREFIEYMMNRGATTGSEHSMKADDFIRLHEDIPKIVTNRSERQYIGYAIEDNEIGNHYHIIPGNSYTGAFDAVDDDGINVQIKGKSLRYGLSPESISSLEMGAMERLPKLVDNAGEVFKLVVVFHDGDLVYGRAVFTISSEKWSDEVYPRFLQVFDTDHVFHGVPIGHHEPLWEARKQYLHDELCSIREEFYDTHHHHMLFTPHPKRDSKGQKRVQVSVSYEGLKSICESCEITNPTYLIVRK